MEEEFTESGNELDKNLFELSVEELRELAKIKNISMPGAQRKPDMVFYIQEVGVSQEDIKNAKDALKNNNKKIDEPVKKKVKNNSSDLSFDKIAIYSENNKFSLEYGRLEKGYNILDKDKAEFFLKMKNVRQASPQEVAEFYGVK